VDQESLPARPGPWPDLIIFCHRLMRALLPNEWIVADQGYTEGLNFVIYKGVGPEWYQTMVATALARHEAINSVFKRFKVLSTHYRHGPECHEITFAAINVYLEHYPAFEVHYDDTGIDRMDFL
jgi:hypothetical protein